MKILHKHNRFTWERDLLCNTLNSAHHKHRYYVTLIIIRRKKKWNWSGQESLNQMRFVFLWLRYNGLQRTAASLIFRYWAPVEPFNSGTFFVAIKDLGANCKDNDASNDGYLIEPSHFFERYTLHRTILQDAFQIKSMRSFVIIALFWVSLALGRPLVHL